MSSPGQRLRRFVPAGRAAGLKSSQRPVAGPGPKGTGLQQLSSLLPLGTHVDNSTILPSAGLQPATVNGDESCYRPDGPAVTLFPWVRLYKGSSFVTLGQSFI